MPNETQSFGTWKKIHPQNVTELLAPVSAPWWIAGGWAIDLFLGQQTREHEDIDIQILRQDQLTFQQHLQGWDLQAIHPTTYSEQWPFHQWQLAR